MCHLIVSVFFIFVFRFLLRPQFRTLGQICRYVSEHLFATKSQAFDELAPKSAFKIGKDCLAFGAAPGPAGIPGRVRGLGIHVPAATFLAQPDLLDLAGGTVPGVEADQFLGRLEGREPGLRTNPRAGFPKRIFDENFVAHVRGHSAKKLTIDTTSSKLRTRRKIQPSRISLFMASI